MLRLILLFALISPFYARHSRRLWQNCNRNPSSPVHITRLDIEPNTVVLPGSILFTMVGYSNSTLGSSALHLDIEREGSWFNIPIPCFRNIGSCTYNDMCTLLDDMERENWLGITRDLARDIQRVIRDNGMTPGLCPQPPQSISIVRNEIQLPRLPAVLSWFAAGFYRANVRVTDNSNGDELVCFDLRIRMERNDEDCDGFWSCIFK